MSEHGFGFECPTYWGKTYSMDLDDVWNGFYIYALAMDCYEIGQLLVLPHSKGMQQRDRLEVGIRARNLRLEGPGQEAWNHACDLCCYVFKDENGAMRISLSKHYFEDMH